MKKDIEWLKEEIGELPCVDTVFNSDGSSYIDSAVPVMAVYDLIDSLDEPETLSIDKKQLIKRIENYIPLHDKTVGDVVGGILGTVKQLPEMEVLSPKWIDEHAVAAAYDGMPDGTEIVYVDELENLLVPKQELPVIPKYMAKYLEFAKSDVSLMRVMVVAYSRDELPEWEKEYDWISENSETFTRAWLDGYEVEEEPLYYALVKGHELIADEGDWTCKYWKFDTSGGYVSPSNRFSTHGRFLIEMSKSEWNKVGINDSNADFVKAVQGNG